MLTIFLGLATSGASAATPENLRAPAPFWLKGEIKQRIAHAGTDGVALAEIRRWVRAGLAGQAKADEEVPPPCPTTDAGYAAPNTVKANACQVAPFQCTANFIYHNGPEPAMPSTSDGRHHFIGTAGHCVERANQPVFMQTAASGVVIAKVGEVEKILGGDIGRNGRGNGGLGNDFAIVQIDEGFNVDPQLPAPVLGPQGIYTGCAPAPVEYYGHGLAVAVGQGRPEGGLATNWYDRSYGWTGVGFPGDSGSGVTLAGTDQAAGNLTHLLVDFRRYPGNDLAGTRVTRALTWMGGGYFLVNQDRSKSRATMADTDCGNADAGSGGGSATTLGG
jgi:hypothetical protein